MAKFTFDICFVSVLYCNVSGVAQSWNRGRHSVPAEAGRGEPEVVCVVILDLTNLKPNSSEKKTCKEPPPPQPHLKKKEEEK